MKFLRITGIRVTAVKLVMLAAFGALVNVSYAAPPGWWTTRGAVNASAPNDSAAVNQGQLKWFTQKAVDELSSNLSVGAGSDLNSLIQGWRQEYQTGGYSAANPKPSDFNIMATGQLKYIGSKVWGRLVTVGYTSQVPPWLTVQSTDLQAANLGQLKTVFNFDLSAPAGQVPAWWQAKYFTGISTNTGVNDDSDGDGLTNLQEYQAGTNPNDFFNGAAPVISIVSGNSQGDLPGQTLSQPLTVHVSNARGTPTHTGTVSFVITSSGGGSLSPSGPVSINSNGLAQVSLTLPSGSSASGTTITVKAQSANSVGTAEVTFTATVGDPTVDPIAPDKPEITSDHGSTEALVEWEDRSNNETAFYVERTADNVNWTRVATLPRDTTSFNDTGLVPDLVYFYRIISHNDASP